MYHDCKEAGGASAVSQQPVLGDESRKGKGGERVRL